MTGHRVIVALRGGLQLIGLWRDGTYDDGPPYTSEGGGLCSLHIDQATATFNEEDIDSIHIEIRE